MYDKSTVVDLSVFIPSDLHVNRMLSRVEEALNRSATMTKKGAFTQAVGDTDQAISINIFIIVRCCDPYLSSNLPCRTIWMRMHTIVGAFDPICSKSKLYALSLLGEYHFIHVLDDERSRYVNRTAKNSCAV